jgi:predicted HicB family RNase H-like nuclease
MRTAKFTKSLTVSIEPQAFERIKQITDQKQISIADWVRAAIEKALENEQPADELRF